MFKERADGSALFFLCRRDLITSRWNGWSGSKTRIARSILSIGSDWARRLFLTKPGRWSWRCTVQTVANSDFKELLNLFENCEVRYLVVGGYAVMHYCEPRYTKDLDIWIEASPDNAQNVFRALAQFGAPLKGISPADFSTEDIVYQMGIPPARVDVIVTLDG